MWQAVIFLLTLLVRLLRATCKSRDELVPENLAFRQQVTALKVGRLRPRLHEADRPWRARSLHLESSEGSPMTGFHCCYVPLGSNPHPGTCP